MARPLICLTIALALVPGGLASPACARRKWGTVEECVAQCGQRWGWPGHAVGNDPWGAVVKQVALDQDMTALVTKACMQAFGSEASTSSDSPSSSPAVVNVSPSVVLTTSLPALITSSVPPVASVTTASPSTFLLSFPSTSSHTSTASSSRSAAVLPTVSIPSNTETRNAAPVIATSSARPSSSQEKLSSSSSGSSSPSSSFFQLPRSSSSFAPSSTSVLSSSTTLSSPQRQSGTPTSSSSAPPSSTSSSGSSGGGARTSAADQAAYLSAHNSVRDQHGADPLSWSGTLADAAQTWADRCAFVHSGGQLGPFGENLAAGTGAGFGPEAAVQGWAGEAAQFNAADPEKAGTNHFTQVVWKATTQVGCAVAECGGILDGTAHFHVCEYQVEGNVIGQYAQNVQA